MELLAVFESASRHQLSALAQRPASSGSACASSVMTHFHFLLLTAPVGFGVNYSQIAASTRHSHHHLSACRFCFAFVVPSAFLVYLGPISPTFEYGLIENRAGSGGLGLTGRRMLGPILMAL